MLLNPWSYPSPPTLTPYPLTTPSSTWITTPTIPPPSPSPPRRLIPHLPVFSISRQPKTLQNQTTPKERRWKFKLHMSLAFQCRLSLPTVPPPSKWKWRSTRTPPLDPIIPVEPHYDLMKTPLDYPPQEERPPSYHLYRSPPYPVNRMSDKPIGSSSNHLPPPTATRSSTARPRTPADALQGSKSEKRKTRTMETTRTMNLDPDPPTPRHGTHAVSTPVWDGR